jgi:hypothetical protein
VGVRVLVLVWVSPGGSGTSSVFRVYPHCKQGGFGATDRKRDRTQYALLRFSLLVCFHILTLINI